MYSKTFGDVLEPWIVREWSGRYAQWRRKASLHDQSNNIEELKTEINTLESDTSQDNTARIQELATQLSAKRTERAKLVQEKEELDEQTEQYGKIRAINNLQRNPWFKIAISTPTVITAAALLVHTTLTDSTHGLTTVHVSRVLYILACIAITAITMAVLFTSFDAWYRYRERLHLERMDAQEAPPTPKIEAAATTNEKVPEQNKKRKGCIGSQWDCGIFASLATSGLTIGAYAYFVYTGSASLGYAAAIGIGAGMLGGLLFDSCIYSIKTFAALPHVLNMLVTGIGASLGLMAAHSLATALSTTELYMNWSMTLVVDICVVSMVVYLVKGLANPLYQAVADKELPQIC